MFGKLNYQKPESVFGKAGIGVTLSTLKSSHMLYVKKYVPNIDILNYPYVLKTDLGDGGIVIDVLLINGTLGNHYIMYSYEETYEINLRI